MKLITRNRFLAYLMSASIALFPSVPTFAITCPGANDAYGPCSDTGGTTSTGGNGWCGACTALVTVYIGGNCSGGAGSGAFNCNDCATSWKTHSQPYTSTPRGAIATAACYSAWLACLATPTAASACTCIYNDCSTSCTATGAPTMTGSDSACS